MADNQQTAQAGGKRTVHRSPNFPSLSLPDALGKARTIYTHDKRAPTSPVVILSHLGFGKTLSGSAGRVLSAMRQYGLLEDANGSLRVSESAFLMLTLSEQSAERVTAIRAAAQKPAMFREVLAEYPDGLPSDATLRDWLISRKEFNPASADGFIRSLKATIEFAKLGGPQYTDRERGLAEVSMPPARETDAMTQTEHQPDYTFERRAPDGTPMSGLLSLTVPCGSSGEQLTVQIRVAGGRLKRSHVAKVRRYLEIAEEDLGNGDE